MVAEQLARKFWLALGSPQGATVGATLGGTTVTAHLRTHDAFSCLVERLTVQFTETTETAEWETMVANCAKGLQALHRSFKLVERDDTHCQALFRSPLLREAYWEATLVRFPVATLAVQRYRVQAKGQRTVAPFVLTEEQLTEFLSALFAPLQESPGAEA